MEVVTALLVVIHSAFVMLVMPPVFRVLAAIVAVFFALAIEVLHPIPVKMQLEQIQFDINFPFWMRSRWPHVGRHIRGHVRRDIRRHVR